MAASPVTRQVYNLFQEPVEQPPLGFSIITLHLKHKDNLSILYVCAMFNYTV